MGSWMCVFRLRADTHNRLFVYSESYITCIHLVLIERIVESFLCIFHQIRKYRIFQRNRRTFLKHNLKLTTFQLHFSITFYDLHTSLKSYELTSLIADQLFQNNLYSQETSRHVLALGIQKMEQYRFKTLMRIVIKIQKAIIIV